MVAIAIIAILATLVVPNLRQQRISQQRRAFIDQLNALTQLGFQKAIATNKVHKISFDMKNNRVELKVETSKKDDKGERDFQRPKGYSLKTTINWPKGITVQNFFIEGTDEMERTFGATVEAYFYVLPEGISQTVIINLAGAGDKRGERRKEIGLVLNPFSGVFKEYDSFQKP